MKANEGMRFGIFIYPGVEAVDLATYGVLSMAKRIRPDIEICTVAPRAGIVELANGLRVVADHGIGAAPKLDVLIIAGGPGWEAQTQSVDTLAFIRQQADAAQIVSVCTGCMILAASGVLDGKSATTKRAVAPGEVSPLERLRADHPQITARETLLVDSGAVITGGGVTLCIDTMLHVLARLFGPQMAADTARMIEYQRAWVANLEQFPSFIADEPDPRNKAARIR